MKLNYLTIILLGVLGITSCSKEEDTSPDPITKANIIGSVNLYDEGVTPEDDNSGMTITIEEISPAMSVTTDASGKFTLVDVPFGTYTIVYEKTGFGTYKKFAIDHNNTTGSSTNIPESPSLGQLSTTKVSDLIASINGNDIILSVTTDPGGYNGKAVYIRYFLSTSSSVDNESYMFYSTGLESKINPNDVTITKEVLLNAGFTSGETVFVKVYGDSFWSNKYDDTDLGRKIFPNLNTTSADAVSFVVP